MATSNVTGQMVRARTALEISSCIKLTTGFFIWMILLSTIVHGQTASTDKNLDLRCKEETGEWLPSYDGECSDGQVIFVTRVYGYQSKHERCDNPVKADETISEGIKAACNSRDTCEISRIEKQFCETYKCYLIYFICNSSDEESPSQPATDSTGGDRGVTKRGNNDTNETAKTNKESMDMYIVTIVVVSVVATVATAFAVTLCLLFFCCQKSPLYRRSTTVHRSPQQQQEEYDYVDESKFQALKPSPGNNAQDRTVSPAKDTISRAYQNTVKSEDDDYEEISSNESLGPPQRTSPSSQTSPSVIIVSVQSESIRSTKSKAGSPRLEDQNNTTLDLQNHYTRQSIDETPEGYSSVLLNPTSYTSAASSTDQLNPIDAKVSGRHGDVLAMSQQQELYNPASSPCPSSSSARSVEGEATDDYSHLSRPGERIRNTENVYDG